MYKNRIALVCFCDQRLKDGALYRMECPFRYKCWKHNPYDPRAVVKVRKDFNECKLYRRHNNRGGKQNAQTCILS